MKKNALIYSVILALGLGCGGLSFASDQIFPLNNKLAQIDVDGVSDEYVGIFNQLTNDIKNDGVRFTYDGTRVSSDRYGKPYFEVENVHIFLKKEILEKYKKYAYIASKKTIFNEAINKIGIYYIFANYPSKAKLLPRMELLDSAGNVLYSENMVVGLLSVDSMSYSVIFGYINEMSEGNKEISDVDLSYSYLTNHAVNLSLKDIQSISSIKFSVIDNPYLNKR